MARMMIAAALMAASMATAPAMAQVDARQHNQRDRIAQGWHSGELTARETGNLARQQHRINRAEDRMWANDGRLGPREQARLAYRQDRASANIYAKKHNGRDRW